MLQISFTDVKFIPWNTIIIIVILITIHIYRVLLISQGKHYSKYLMCNNLFCSNTWKGIYIQYKQESSQDPKAQREPDSLWPPSADFLLLILSQALWPTCHSSDTVGTTSGGAWALVTPMPGVPSTWPTIRPFQIFPPTSPSQWGSPTPFNLQSPFPTTYAAVLIPVLSSFFILVVCISSSIICN